MNPIVMIRKERRYSGPDSSIETEITKHYYWCLGCDSLHGIAIWPDRQHNGAGWEFTGTLECPTYSPSQLTKYPMGDRMITCHTFIRNGQIEYLGDCTHEYAGKTIPLPPLPDSVLKLLG